MIFFLQGQDIHHIIWVCPDSIPPNSQTTKMHAREMQMEWFVPISIARNVVDKYNGWDTRKNISENGT